MAKKQLRSASAAEAFLETVAQQQTEEALEVQEKKIPAAMTAGTRKCVHLSQIRKVEEILDYKMTNHMLDEGWQLLDISQSAGQIKYVLGLPSI